MELRHAESEVVFKLAKCILVKHVSNINVYKAFSVVTLKIFVTLNPTSSTIYGELLSNNYSRTYILQ